MGTVDGQRPGARVAVSLIIPCCNEAEGLPALEAVLPPLIARLADLGAVETILIDDGSTDETWPMLQELAKRVPNVRLVRHRVLRRLRLRHHRIRRRQIHRDQRLAHRFRA